MVNYYTGLNKAAYLDSRALLSMRQATIHGNDDQIYVSRGAFVNRSQASMGMISATVLSGYSEKRKDVCTSALAVTTTYRNPRV